MAVAGGLTGVAAAGASYDTWYTKKFGEGGSGDPEAESARNWLKKTNHDNPGLNQAFSKWVDGGGGELPEGVDQEYLQNYRKAAQDAVKTGIDKSGLQARRIQTIDQALNPPQ
jgi:hypothetical protein